MIFETETHCLNLMNNKDDLLKNYIESQKRQKEILEETKKDV